MFVLRSKNNGFTLIEILISLAIISIIAASILGAFASNFSIIYSMGRKSQAVEEGKRIIDLIIAERDIMTVPFDNTTLTAFINSKDDTTDNLTVSREGNVDNAYTVLGTVKEKITIKVSYQNNTKFVYLTTLLQ